jgi:hypothetical protein
MGRLSFSMVSVLGLMAGPASLAAPPPAHTITAIRAVLYHQRTGDFDTTDVTNPGVALWNTEIGEGVARTPSGATLVLVQVTGAPLPGGEVPGHVRLTVRIGSTEVYSDSVTLRTFFTEHRSMWIPFLVYDPTPCTPWKLTATLVNASGAAESTLSKSIPFACGE